MTKLEEMTEEEKNQKIATMLVFGRLGKPKKVTTDEEMEEQLRVGRELYKFISPRANPSVTSTKRPLSEIIESMREESELDFESEARINPAEVSPKYYELMGEIDPDTVALTYLDVKIQALT